jgi:hypothetical protein
LILVDRRHPGESHFNRFSIFFRVTGSRAILPFRLRSKIFKGLTLTDSDFGGKILKGVTHCYLLRLWSAVASLWREKWEEGQRPMVEGAVGGTLNRIGKQKVMAVPKVATSVTSLSGRRLSGNKTGNRGATIRTMGPDWKTES